MKIILLAFLLTAAFAAAPIVDKDVAGYVDEAQMWFSEYRRSIPRYSLHVLKTGQAHWPPDRVSNSFNPQDLDYLESITLIALVGLIPALVLLCVGPVFCITCCCCCGKPKEQEALNALRSGASEFTPSSISRVKRVLISIVIIFIWILCLIGYIGNGFFGARMGGFVSHVNETASKLSVHAADTSKHLTDLAASSFVPVLGNVTTLVSYGDVARTGIMPMMKLIGESESYRLIILHLTFLLTIIITIPACLGLCKPGFWRFCFFAWLLVFFSWLVMELMVLNFGVHFAFSVPVVDLCPWVEVYMATGNLTAELSNLLLCGGDNLTRPYVNIVSELKHNSTIDLNAARARYDAAGCAKTPQTEQCQVDRSIIVRNELLIADANLALADLSEITHCNISRDGIPPLNDIVCGSLLGWADTICVVELLIATALLTLFIPLHMLIERSFRSRRPQFLVSSFLPFAKKSTGPGTKAGNELIGRSFSRTTHTKI